jgi:hypothetical protein
VTSARSDSPRSSTRAPVSLAPAYPASREAGGPPRLQPNPCPRADAIYPGGPDHPCPGGQPGAAFDEHERLGGRDVDLFGAGTHRPRHSLSTLPRGGYPGVARLGPGGVASRSPVGIHTHWVRPASFGEPWTTPSSPRHRIAWSLPCSTSRPRAWASGRPSSTRQAATGTWEATTDAWVSSSDGGHWPAAGRLGRASERALT